MTVELPREKRDRVKQSIQRFRRLSQCRICEFASFIGFLESCCITLKYGRIHMRIFKRARFLALLHSKNDYEATMPLIPGVRLVETKYQYG